MQSRTGVNTAEINQPARAILGESADEMVPSAMEVTSLRALRQPEAKLPVDAFVAPFARRHIEASAKCLVEM